MADHPFNKVLPHTLRHEGGYVNNPNDRGGETFRGISRVSNPDWIGWKRINWVKERGAVTAKLIDATLAGDPEMEQMVAVLYHSKYWRPFESLEASDRITAKLFDTAVNVGVGGTVKILQRTVNRLGPISKLAADGVIGPRTRAGFDVVVTGDDDEGRFLNIFCQEQEAHYRRLVARDSSQEVFLSGWLKRAAWLPE